MRSFLYSSSVYSCHLFLTSSASVSSIPFLSFIVPIFAWNIPLVSLIFLKRSPVFPILLFPSISLHWSLRKAFLSLPCYSLELWIQMGISFLFSSAFCFSFLSYIRPPQTTILSFCVSFSWGWFWSQPPVQCYEPPSIVLQALWSNLDPWSICHFHCVIIGICLSHTWMA